MRKIIYTALITLFILVNIILVGLLVTSAKDYVDKINRNEIQVAEENVNEEEQNTEEDMDIVETIKKFIFKVD